MRICSEEADLPFADWSKWVPWDAAARHLENVDRGDDWCTRALDEALQLQRESRAVSCTEVVMHYGALSISSIPWFVAGCR